MLATPARGEGRTRTRRKKTATKRSKGPRLGGHPACPPRPTKILGLPNKQKNTIDMVMKPADGVDEWLHEAYGFRDLTGESTERLKKLASTVLRRCPVRNAPRFGWS
jgi:hypothetical protein